MGRGKPLEEYRCEVRYYEDFVVCLSSVGAEDDDTRHQLPSVLMKPEVNNILDKDGLIHEVNRLRTSYLCFRSEPISVI